MAKLYFKVEADYEQLVKLREEYDKLENAIRSGKAGTESAQRLIVVKNEMRSLVTEATQSGVVLETQFKQKILESSKGVDNLTYSMIEQRSVVKNIEQDIRSLGQAYQSLGKNDSRRNSLKLDFEAAGKALQEEKASLFGLQQEHAKAKVSVKGLKDEFRSLTGATNKSSQSMSSSADVMKSMFSKIGGVYAIKQLGQQIINTRAEFELMEVSIETLVGKSKAAPLLGDIKSYAAVSPLTLKGISSAAQMMIGFNLEAEKVPAYIRAIGDISMGNEQKFQSLSLAFSQTSAAGKLMGQDLNQMINAGFNPLTVMAQRAGKTIGELKKEMSDGAISAEMVQQAFIDATSAGGKFFNMSENASKTINGQLSNLQDAVDGMFNDLGTKSQSFITAGIDGATTLVKNYEDIGRVLTVLIATYGAYRAALMATVVIKKAVALSDNIKLVMMFRKELGLLTAAQQAFNIKAMANPYVLLAAVVVGACAAIWQLVSAKKAETQAIEDAVKPMREEFTQTNLLIGKLKDANLAEEERKKILEELKTVNPDIVKGIENEATAYEELSKRLEAYNKAKLAEIAIKNFSMQDDFDDAVKELTEANDALKSESASIIDVYSTLFTRFREMETQNKDIPADIKNLFTSIIDSSIPETEKVEAMFSAYDAIKEKVKAGRGAYTGQDWTVAQNLFRGLDLSDYKDALDEVTDATDDYEEKAKNLKTKIDNIAKAIYTDEKDRQDFIMSQWAIYFPSEVKKVETAIDFVNPEDKKDLNDLVGLIRQADKEWRGMSEKAKSDTSLIPEVDKKKKDLDDLLKQYESITHVSYNAKPKEDTTLRKLVSSNSSLSLDLEISQIQDSIKLETDKNKKLELQVQLRAKLLEKGMLSIDEQEKEALKDKGPKETKALKEEFVTKRKLVTEQHTQANQTEDKLREAEELKDRLKNQADYATGYIEIENKLQQTLKKIKTDKSLTQEAKVIKSGAAKDSASFDQEQLGIALEVEDLFTTLVGSVDSIINLGIAQIEDNIKILQVQLDKANTDGADPKKIGAINVQIGALKTQLKITRDIQNAEGGSDDTAEELKKKWGHVGQSMQAVNGIIDSVQEAFGDLISEAGNDAIDMAQTVASSVISMIGLISTTAWTGTEAVKGVEKASIILTIIAMAVQAIMAIVNVCLKYFSNTAKLNASIDESKKRVELLEKSYKQLEKAIEQTIGHEYYQRQIELVRSLRQQQEEYNGQLRDANALMKEAGGNKGKQEKAQEAIDKSKEALAENQEEQQEVIRKFYEELVTTNLKDFASNLAQSIIGSFSEGIQGIKKVFDTAIDDLIKQMVTKQLDLKMQEIFKSTFDRMNSSFNIETGDTKLSKAEIEAIKAEYQAGRATAEKISEEYYRMLEELGLLDDPEQQADSKGFQAMSQDTGDELNGRFTAMQISMASAVEYLSREVENTDRIANIADDTRDILAASYLELRGINENTGAIVKPIQDMAKDIKDVKRNTERL